MLIKSDRLAIRALVNSSVAAIVFASSASAATYEVGPGKQYATLGNVAWYALKPGDTVYISYQPTPYYEKILISGRGTPTQWIRILGVPGPNGELPVISGRNATTSKNMHYRWQDPTGGSAIQWDGVVQVAVRAPDPDGTAPLPGYIEIANLQVQDGYKDYQFTAENGMKANYDGFAACIYARSVQHFVVRNNVLTNCGQGFYNWTGSGSNYWDGLQIDTVVRGNYFYNNGNPGSFTEHQSYTESDGVIIEQNRFGPMRAGAAGSQVKDRSAGTIVRYNFIESAAGWMLDLVEPQESYAAIGNKPTYAQTFVYGNILMNRGSQNLVHWNEDHGAGIGRATLPNGRLFFYHNTVLTIADQADLWKFSVFNTTSGSYDCVSNSLPGVIDVRNNMFVVLPRTAGGPTPEVKFAYCQTQNTAFGRNWVSPGWMIGSSATTTGLADLISPANNEPGFVNAASGDVHLRSDSSALGIGGALAVELTNNALGQNLSPTYQYVYHRQLTPRPASASGEVGALTVVGDIELPPDSPPPPQNVRILR